MLKGSIVALITPFEGENLSEDTYIKLINYHNYSHRKFRQEIQKHYCAVAVKRKITYNSRPVFAFRFDIYYIFDSVFGLPWFSVCPNVH